MCERLLLKALMVGEKQQKNKQDKVNKKIKRKKIYKRTICYKKLTELQISREKTLKNLHIEASEV